MKAIKPDRNTLIEAPAELERGGSWSAGLASRILKRVAWNSTKRRPNPIEIAAPLTLGPTPVPCKICGDKSLPFDVVDFNKYCSHGDFYSYGFSGVSVAYYRCRICSLLFTPFFDGWTTEDFKLNIYNHDYKIVDGDYKDARPKLFAADMARRWGDCFDAKILDYGSGSGVFSRELARLGYKNVKEYDPFSNPVSLKERFDIITCFEVIEHTPSPVATLQHMSTFLEEDGCIIVSQTLQPPDILRLRGNWWYLGPRNGHICTFTPDSMALLAQRCGFVFHHDSEHGLHAFSRAPRSRHARRALATVGQPHYFAPLFAPGPALRGPTGNWLELEVGAGETFRWSRSESLSWAAPSMPQLPATLRVVLPFEQYMTPDILEQAILTIGPETVKLKQDGKCLIGDLVVERSSPCIEVRTGAPVTPRALRGVADDRTLGVAVLASPT